MSGSLITVTWQIYSRNKRKWDWVVRSPYHLFIDFLFGSHLKGLFPVGVSNKKYLDYHYIDMTTNAMVRGYSPLHHHLSHMDQVFEKPRAPGTYEVRYFSYETGKYADFRKSNIILIQ